MIVEWIISKLKFATLMSQQWYSCKFLSFCYYLLESDENKIKIYEKR